MQYRANISNKNHIIIKTLGSNNEPIKKKKERTTLARSFI